MYKLSCPLGLLASRCDLESAAAEKQCNQEYHAVGIYAKAEILEFSATAAKEQDDEQNPSAVATAKNSATAVVATVVAFVAATVVKHTVEHFYLHFAEQSAFVLDQSYNRLIHCMVIFKIVLH